MAPKKSAPAHLTITGKVKGPPKISKDGTAVIVKKTLDEGATLTEKFPKRRATGKQKVLAQAIPAEDVLRTIEEATQSVAKAVAGAEQNKAKKQIDGIQALANQMMDGQAQELKKQKKKTQRAAQQAAAVRSQLKKKRPTFAAHIVEHMNSAPEEARAPPGARGFEAIDTDSDV